MLHALPRPWRARTTGLAGFALLLTLILLLPAGLEGQIRFGGHFARAQEAFGGAGGIGARVGLGLPMFPVEAYGSAEYFFPACALGGCGLSGLSADLNMRFPMPFLNPYATGGWVLRRVDPGGGGDVIVRSGLHLGLGVGAGLPGARAFGEARYEFVDAPSKQFVLRLGFLAGG